MFGEPKKSVKKVERKGRSCLRCQKPFDSRGIHHRICKDCGRLNAVNYAGGMRQPMTFVRSSKREEQ